MTTTGSEYNLFNLTMLVLSYVVNYEDNNKCQGPHALLGLYSTYYHSISIRGLVCLLGVTKEDFLVRVEKIFNDLFQELTIGKHNWEITKHGSTVIKFEKPPQKRLKKFK
jgi:hypothetical protein